jgi:lysophospholipase L1-like esterase
VKRALWRAGLGLFGLVAGVLLAEAALDATAAALSWRQSVYNWERRGDGGCRILCVGESTTAGPGEASYPAQLELILRERFPELDVRVVNRGVVGIRSPRIARRLPLDLRRFDPQIVVVMMGENDNLYRRSAEAVRPSRFDDWRLARLARRALGLDPAPDERLDGEELIQLATEPAFRRKEASSAMVDREIGRLQRRLRYAPADGRTLARLDFLTGLRAPARREPAPGSPGASLPEERSRLLPYLFTNWSRLSAAEREALPERLREYIRREARADRGLFGALWRAGGLEEASRELESLLTGPKAGESSGQWGLLGLMRLAQGRRREADDCFRRAEERRRAEENPDVRRSYAAVRDAVLAEGRSLVCVQYPVRSAEPLRERVGGGRRVHFVDNSEPFRRAVAERGMWETFVDVFGGDFGHCTPAGNRLLAEGVADVIAREILSVRRARGPAPEREF